MKKLAAIIVVLAIVVVGLMVIGTLTTNPTVGNDVFIDQLNGGDNAYLAMQAYTQYSTVLTSIIYGVVAVLVVLIFVFALKNIFKIRNKVKNDKEN